MKIESLKIDGFGIFSEAGIELVAPGLTIICAANGGGKTTLRDFLRASLFGFGTEKNVNRYERPSGAHGGSVRFISGDGDGYLLAFDAGRKKQVLSRVDGAQAAGLEPLLGSASLRLYKNVFAIGLHELQDAASLNNDEIHNMIGAFGSSRSGRGFQVARAALVKEAEELFKVGGRLPQFNAALAKHEEDLAELKQCRADANEYWTHETRLEGLRAKIAECRREESAARLMCQHLETLEKAWPDWIAVQGLRQQLGELLPQVERFPPEGTSALDGLKAQREQCERESRSLGETQAKAQQTLRELVVSHELLGQSALLDELGEGCRLHEENLAQQSMLEVKSAGLRRAFEDELLRLGPGMQDALVAFDDGVASMAEKAEAARQLAEAQRAKEQRQVEVDRNQRRRTDLEGEAETARSAFAEAWPAEPPPQSEIDKRLKLVASIRSELGKVELLRVEHGHILQEAEEASKRASTIRQRLGAAAGSGPGGATTASSNNGRTLAVAGWVVLGVGLLMAALSYPNPLAAVVALLLGIGGWIVCWQLSRAVAAAVGDASGYLDEELKEWEARATEAVRKGEVATQKLAEAEAGLGQLGQAFGDKVLDAQQWDEVQAKLMLASEKRRTWEATHLQVLAAAAKVQDSAKDGKALGLELGLAEETYATAKARWVAWLKLRGLDAVLSPEAAEAVCHQVLRVREALGQSEEAKAGLAQLSLQIAVYVGKLEALFAVMGRPLPESGDISRSLRALGDERNRSRQNLEKREALIEEIPEREKAMADLDRQREGVQLRLGELLAEGGAADEDEFRIRARAWEQRNALLADERQYVSRLEILSAHGEAVQRLQEELGTYDSERLSGTIGEARLELETLSESTSQLNRELGQIEQARLALASEDKVLECDQRCQAGEVELRDLAEDWAVRKLALWLMEKARAKIEVERQPAVLQSASACLKTMSGGKFTHIRQPLGSQEYHIVGADGLPRDNSQFWNTALREKAYLSLRFGLIDAYCAGAEPLPLILDDPLVNLDPANYAGAVRCIDEMAQLHQIFYLTCRPHTLGDFSRLDTPPDLYEIRDGMFEKLPVNSSIQAKK